MSIFGFLAWSRAPGTAHHHPSFPPEPASPPVLNRRFLPRWQRAAPCTDRAARLVVDPVCECVMPKTELDGLPVIEAPDSEKISVAVKPDDVQSSGISDREKLPHLKNVDLVTKSGSDAGASGFGMRHSLGLSLGLLLLILITYLIFG